MMIAGDVENYIIAGEADFDQNIFPGHHAQESLRIMFLHYVHAVTNALRMALFYRRADMKQLFRRDKILREFSRMQRDVDFGVNAVKKIQHAHVQIEVMDRQVCVLWHDKIQADDAWIRSEERR